MITEHEVNEKQSKIKVSIENRDIVQTLNITCELLLEITELLTENNLLLMDLKQNKKNKQ
jgi:hypothetical protein